jgi:hypothetical protein
MKIGIERKNNSLKLHHRGIQAEKEASLKSQRTSLSLTARVGNRAREHAAQTKTGRADLATGRQNEEQGTPARESKHRVKSGPGARRGMKQGTE